MAYFTDFTEDELAGALAARGLAASHAQRLLRALYGQPGAFAVDERRVGRAVVELFADHWRVRSAQVARRHESADGTVKLLLELARGGTIETVLMPAYRADRAAACVSSQIGCAMRCDFCASTKAGLERDLVAGEIVEQYLHLKAEAQAMNRRIASLVFMGMGEPLLNLDQVAAAIKRIAEPHLGGLGYRNITVSTVGVVSGIDRLAELDLGVHLAVSLHAPDDETRSRLIPMNRRWRVIDVIDAAKRFHARTGRIVTIEYTLLAGINDSDAQARLLADRLAGFRAHVNLIPYNPIGVGLSGFAYERPSRQRMGAFAEILRQAGVVAHFRRTRGDDVSAACGQLRHQLQVLTG